MKFSDQAKQLRKILGYSQVDMAAYLGLAPTYLSALENSAKEPSSTLKNYVQLLWLAVQSGLIQGTEGTKERAGLATLRVMEDPPERRSPLTTLTKTTVRLFSWSQVSNTPDLEELFNGPSLQDIASDCPDPSSFAVRLEGAMDNRFPEGDSLILMPTVAYYSGCYVVCRFKSGGLAFRRLELVGDWIQLVPLEERFRVSEHTPDDFSWIYPVYGRYTQLWNR